MEETRWVSELTRSAVHSWFETSDVLDTSDTSTKTITSDLNESTRRPRYGGLEDKLRTLTTCAAGVTGPRDLQKHTHN